MFVCHQAIKIDKDALEYKTLENSIEERESARERVKMSRSDNAKNVIEAAELGGQSLLSKLFYNLFPTDFVYLGDMRWYQFIQSRWRRLKKNISVIEMLTFTDLNKLVDDVIEELKK